MKKPKVSVVIPVYKPDPEIFKKIKDMLKKQTVKAEVIENWNMPEAKSMNVGIRKAKGEIIVTLCADCVPENESWLEKLIKPLERKNVVATISDLYLPEEYWRKYPFLIKIFTLPDRKIRKPEMDARGCAYRKEDIKKAGLFNEDPKVIAIEAELAQNLEKIGKIVRSDVKVHHLHHFKSFKKVIQTFYVYSKANGMTLKKDGTKNGGFWHRHFWHRVIRAIPFLGFVSMLYRFPIKEYLHLLPIYMILAAPINHIVNVFGFWSGFLFKQKESSRNLEVLNKTKSLSRKDTIKSKNKLLIEE